MMETRGTATPPSNRTSPAADPYDRQEALSCEPNQDCVRPPQDRVTLTLPFYTRRNPFDKYRGKSYTEPAEYPHRLIIRKLGLTEKEFEDKLTQDIDEMLQEIELERRQALLDTLPYERILTKQDCLQMFASGPPPAGPLRGIYNWAIEPDEANPNFDAGNSSSPPSHAG